MNEILKISSILFFGIISSNFIFGTETTSTSHLVGDSQKI